MKFFEPASHGQSFGIMAWHIEDMVPLLMGIVSTVWIYMLASKGPFDVWAWMLAGAPIVLSIFAGVTVLRTVEIVVDREGDLRPALGQVLPSAALRGLKAAGEAVSNSTYFGGIMLVVMGQYRVGIAILAIGLISGIVSFLVNVTGRRPGNAGA